MGRQIESGSRVWYAGSCIGRISGKSDGYGGYDGGDLILDDPSVAEVLHRHFNPDLPFEIGQKVHPIDMGKAFNGEPIVVARRSTETRNGVEWEYEVEGHLSPSQQHHNEFPGSKEKPLREWMSADVLVPVFTPTGWVNPNPIVDEPTA